MLLNDAIYFTWHSWRLKRLLHNECNSNSIQKDRYVFGADVPRYSAVPGTAVNPCHPLLYAAYNAEYYLLYISTSEMSYWPCNSERAFAVCTWITLYRSRIRRCSLIKLTFVAFCTWQPDTSTLFAKFLIHYYISSRYNSPWNFSEILKIPYCHKLSAHIRPN